MTPNIPLIQAETEKKPQAENSEVFGHHETLSFIDLNLEKSFSEVGVNYQKNIISSAQPINGIPAKTHTDNTFLIQKTKDIKTFQNITLARKLYWFAIAGIIFIPLALLSGKSLSTGLILTSTISFFLLSTIGVLLPNLQMFGNIFFKNINAQGKICLTFDDGPNPVTTTQVLNALREHGHHATFFVIAKKAEQYPELLRKIVADGHEIGLHSHAHQWYYSFLTPAAVEKDIIKTQDIIEKICGVRPKILRPPAGYVSHFTFAGAKRAGITLIGCSARSWDGTGPTNPEKVVKRIKNKLSNGDIVLLHDSSERDSFIPATIQALPEILRILKEKGLSSVPLKELMK